MSLSSIYSVLQQSFLLFYFQCYIYDQKYSIKDLAEALNDKERNISDAIKSQGFTGFREYINYIRLEHFKQLIAQNPKKNVKELMFACGFSSRATFYRNFSERYGISPSKFIEYQQSK